MRSFAFKCLMWGVLAVTVVLFAVAVSVGLALFVPVLAVWGAWEWFVGRHKPTMTLEEELAEMIKTHG